MNNTTFDAWEDDEGRQPPDWKEVEAEIIREVKIYNYYLYERNRQQQYPEIKDQLDMLYHDLKSGNLNNGTWIAAIDAVKENNPKRRTRTEIITMAHFAKLGIDNLVIDVLTIDTINTMTNGGIEEKTLVLLT